MATVKYWMDIAEYDLDTAKAMLSTKRYLYVGFMCHQAIEKALKGYCVYKGIEKIPYTHNLLTLAQKSEIIAELDEEQLDFIDTIQPLNIEARYPESKKRLLETLSEDRCSKILKKTEGILRWLKAKL
jgi:HEPN domain-containing protein